MSGGIMKLIKSFNKVYRVLILFALFSAFQLSANAEDAEHEFSVRGGVGGGRILWGYIDHGSGSGDLGTGAGGMVNLNLMYGYSFLGVEGSLTAVPLGTLEWEDKDDFDVNHKYKSKGSGFFTIFDLKVGLRLFTEPEDMGYTFLYAGYRTWSTERDQDSVEVDGSDFPTTVKREANGGGWIFGYRDVSTLGPNDGFAIVVQTGLWFGKAPVDEMKTDGVKSSRKEKENLSFGGELGGGFALQNIGLSVIGGIRGDVNLTVFHDPAAPEDEESVFGFGYLQGFVEVTKKF
jgi:hypothetical protein